MLQLIEIFIIALATGVFFFAGLRYSVGKMVRSRYAAIWAAGSFLVRTGVTLAVFYWLSAGSAERLLLCVAAFTVARFGVARLTRSTGVARFPRAAGTISRGRHPLPIDKKGGNHAAES